MARKIFGSNGLWFSAIYCAALAITLYYAVVHMKLVSDQACEYNFYLRAVEDLRFEVFPQGAMFWDNLVNSCPMVHLVPAAIQRLLHLPVDIWFKIYPCFIYSLAPAFVYLTSRKYLNISFSVASACLIMAGFFFLYYPAMGRVSIAWGFASGFFWALSGRRLIWACVFALLLPFSHYATSFICLLVVAPAVIYFLKTRRWQEILPILVLFMTILVWDVWIMRVPFLLGCRFVSGVVGQAHLVDNAVTNTSYAFLFYSPGMLETETLLKPPLLLAVMIFVVYSSIIKTRIRLRWAIGIVVLVDSAMFLNFSQVMMIIAGLSVAVVALDKGIPAEMKAAGVAGYLITAAAIFVPYIRDNYGPARTFATCILVMAPFFTLGVRNFARRIGMPGLLLMGGIVGIYAVLSKCIHLTFLASGFWPGVFAVFHS